MNKKLWRSANRRSSKKDDSQDETRSRRIHVLQREMRLERDAYYDRARNTEAKASYVMVAVGVLLSISVIWTIESDPPWLLAVSLLASIGSLICMAWVLWPRSYKVPAGRDLVNAWVDDDSVSLAEMEDSLLEIRVREVEGLHERNQKLATATIVGTIIFIAAVLFLGFALVCEWTGS